MSDISVNALSLPTATLPGNIQPESLSGVAVNNISTSPSSNTPLVINTLDADNIIELEPITGETFVDYMHNVRPHDQRPRTFRGLGFGYERDCKPGAFYEPLIFNGDNFSDLNFRGHSTNYRIEMKNCIITAEQDQLIWYGSNFKNSCWEGTTIDGSCKGQQSTIRDCELSQAEMSGCKLKDIHIVDNASCQIEQTNFSNCELENITFSNNLSSQYTFRNISFRDIQAGKFALERVNCRENVDFTNAKIDKFSLSEGTKLTGAIFGNDAPDLIKLDPEMFYGITQIDRHLNSINNPDTGALFFNTLASINNNAVRCAFAEQLVAMLDGDGVLAETYKNSPSLKLSFIREMTNNCYTNSEIIKNFIDRELLNHSRNALLSDSPHADLTELFMKLKQEELFDYQFPINQLITAHPELRDKFYQQTPIKDFVSYIEKEMMIEDDDAPHHIFYNRENKTALYLPANDFRDLIRSSQTPERYALLRYQPEPGEEKTVTDIPAAMTDLSSVLEDFPKLHSLWSRSGGIMTPVIRFLFSHAPGLENQPKNRAAEIENHMISLLMRKVDASAKLTTGADESLLSEILVPFYLAENEDDRNKAKALRGQLIELAQHRLPLSRKKFSDAEQKIIAGMIIIRMLADLFSTRFYAEEEKSAYAPRQLARCLIDDLNTFWPGIINPADADEWKERLVPQLSETYTCSAIVAGMVASYKIPGEQGAEINQAIKLHYPLI
ncbi:pentapeptide repeat-containing protein [Pantoea sp. App145]|uniref:pentapeptide repeat-containing protein n=1 Tax=Pantoea sp. App145 TaxID=3071567 RepID=UPI003A7FEFAD